MAVRFGCDAAAEAHVSDGVIRRQSDRGVELGGAARVIEVCLTIF